MYFTLHCSVPGLLEQIIKPPMRGAGLTIYIQLYNSIFFFVFACVLYAVVSRTPQAALVSLCTALSNTRSLLHLFAGQL